ncbi:MAG: tetratricopeptide repeat protein [Candidatus Krumholzibacteria bacterium]|nr:tetratricopeptide repeat protein [Candidatus Krumholzibacteria bacterium]
MRSILYILILPILALAVTGCSDASIKHYNLGIEAADSGDIDRAISEWKESLEHRYDDSDTQYNLGMALLEKELYDDAAVHLLEAARLSPDDNEIQYACGKALEAKGALPEAKKAYRLSITLKPNYFPPYIGIASIAMKQEQYRTAEKYATQALNISMRNLEGNLILSEAYFMQGNLQEAYAQLLSIRHMFPREPALLLLMGKVLSERHMHEDAIATLRLAKANGATGGDLFLYMGRSSYTLSQYNNAEKFFQLALYGNDTDIRALKGLAETRFKRGDYDKSLKTWKEISSISPMNMEAKLGIGMIYINTGRSEEAESILGALAEEEDFPPRTLYYLGHALMRTGKKAEARESFEEFLKTWEGDRALISEVKDIIITLQ